MKPIHDPVMAAPDVSRDEPTSSSAGSASTPRNASTRGYSTSGGASRRLSSWISATGAFWGCRSPRNSAAWP